MSGIGLMGFVASVSCVIWAHAEPDTDYHAYALWVAVAAVAFVIIGALFKGAYYEI